MKRLAWSLLTAWLTFWGVLYSSNLGRVHAYVDDFVVPVIAATVTGLVTWGAIGLWQRLRT